MTLHRGQRFTMGGRTYKVEYVNPSRAHCVARVPTIVTIKGRTFKVQRREAIDIAPNSGVDVLAELERSR